MIPPEIKRILDQVLSERKFSACALGFQKLGMEPVFTCLGKASHLPNAQNINTNAMFDLASLTKVIFTTTIAAKLIENEMLHVDIPLKKHPGLEDIGELVQGTAYENCTFEDLLLHRAGFPMRADYAKLLPENYRKQTNSLDASRQIIRATAQIPSTYSIGEKTIYSDPGFIFLAEIFALLKKDSTENMWFQEIQTPLNLVSIRHTRQFRPSDVFVLAAKDLQKGEVQDSEARYLGKLCGHAGLFGNIHDLVSFGQVWLMAYTEGHSYLSKKTAKKFVDPYMNSQKSDRRLGWDGVSENSSAGLISPLSIGHLGYTGTSLWIDLEKRIVVGLLSNRTLTQLENSDQFLTGEQIRDFNQFRREVHNAIWRIF